MHEIEGLSAFHHGVYSAGTPHGLGRRSININVRSCDL